eukprot:1358652-Lingulodinium_polyedra.AAC.1
MRRPSRPLGPLVSHQGQAGRSHKGQHVFALHTDAAALALPGVRCSSHQSMAGRKDNLIYSFAHALTPALHCMPSLLLRTRFPLTR